MGKKQDAIYKALLAAITKLQTPEANPAQNFLTNEAMAGAEFLKKGEFNQLPKGMFFDFQMPSEQIKQYNKTANVGREGTFALGDDAGAGGAMKLQSKFLGDKFARDAGQNYQNNISGAAGNIRGALSAAAGAKSNTDMGVIQALQGLYGSPALNKPGIGGQLLGALGGLGGGALSSLKPW